MGGTGPEALLQPVDQARRLRVAQIPPAVSIARTSARPHHSGIPSRSQTTWLQPWWSGWAWVSAWALSRMPAICRKIRRSAWRVAASISTSRGEVDVDRVARPAVEHPQPVRQFLHRQPLPLAFTRRSSPRRSRAPRGISRKRPTGAITASSSRLLDSVEPVTIAPDRPGDQRLQRQRLGDAAQEARRAG